MGGGGRFQQGDIFYVAVTLPFCLICQFMFQKMLFCIQMDSTDVDSTSRAAFRTA